MRLVIVVATVLALAHARPETYRENEEFQYSRSSSDDGSKSGYYGAQRGNMGGNYEKAHNMDTVAQHQLSSVVGQVDGELGSGADTKTGSVYTAGNSRGIYGSGKFDLSNLRGRNFAEGTSYGDAHSSAYSQSSGYHGETYSANNARYRNQQSQLSSQNTGYGGVGESASFLDNQSEDDLQHSSSNQYSNQAANNYRYHSQSSSHGSSSYDQSSSDLSTAGGSAAAGRSGFASGSSRLTSPIRVYVRPGSQTSIPVSIHAYDASKFDSSHALTEQNQESYAGSGLQSRPKHYESSYSYKKEWEKHDTQPYTVIPTENPFPKHSDLYDNSQNLQQSSLISDSAYNGYSKNAQYSNSRQSAYESNYKTEGQHLASGSNLQAYTANNRKTQNVGEINNLVEDLNSKPKSYQSSYSYHKSWERRGDPYVIIPSDNGHTSQRLIAASGTNGQRSTHHHGSGYNYGQQGYSEDCDCDENGHIRVARSYDENDYQNYQQQSQDLFDLGQQRKFSNLEDLGQQSQNQWDNLGQSGQETQSDWGHLENLDQQTQDVNSENLRLQNQQSQDTLDDLGQQTQNKWDNLEDLGQQAQNKWDNLESLSQQKNNVANLANLEQKDHPEKLGQESQHTWDNLASVNQQQQNHFEKLGQEVQTKWDQLEDLAQHTQNNERFEDLGKPIQNKWDNLDTLNQKSNNNLQTDNLEQETRNTWHQNSADWNLENTNQHVQRNWKHQDINTYNQHQATLNDLQNLQNFDQNQQTHNWWNLFSKPQQFTETSAPENVSADNLNKNVWFGIGNNENSHSNTGYTNSETHFDSFHTQHQYQTSHSSPKNTDASSLNSLWNKIDNIAGIPQEHIHAQTSSSSSTQDQSNLRTDQYGANFWDIIQDENVEHDNPLSPTQNIYKTPKYNSDQSNNTDFLKPRVTTTTQNIQPVNVGRGDIDSEDISTESIKSSDSLDKLFENIPKNTHKYKNPQEIELLSLKKVDDNSKEKETHQYVQHDNTEKESTKETDLMNNTFSLSQIQGRENLQQLENSHVLTQTDENFDQQSISNQYETYNQYGQKLEGQSSANFDQNLQDQQSQKFEPVVAYGDHSKKLEEQSLENFGQNLQDQQSHYYEPTVTYGDHSKKLEEQSLENFDQNLQDQQSQSYEPIVTYGDHSKKLEEQLFETFDQNLQDKLSQHSEPIDTFTNTHNNFQKHDIEYFPSNNEKTVQNMWNTNNQQIIALKEPDDKKQQASDLDTVKKMDDSIIVPVEITTEKPGFWKSIGNKLSNAKESVVSWFKS